jgi:predicted aspartyl protease
LPRREILEGSIDDLNRPLVRIEAPGFPDPLVAFIDTGFNGAIIVDEPQAARLGFRISHTWRTSVRLASQREEDFLLARGTFPWLGQSVPISAYVLIETVQERSARVARKTEEEILIGTELLSACRLEIDFPARRVRIEPVE